ncbi:MAG: zf-HC2 domain-containing protein [Planctomycetota bacterium]
MENCKQIEAKLYSYASGEISREDKISIEKHLSTCHACAEEAELMKKIFSLSGNLVFTLTPYPFLNIKKRIQKSRVTRILRISALSAAAALICLVLFNLWNLRTEGEQTNITTVEQPNITSDDVGKVLDMFGILSHFDGDVEIVRKGTNNIIKGATSLPIISGDTIKTNETGSARIDLSEKTQVYLNNSAEMEIGQEDDNSVLIKLAKGEIYACTLPEGKHITIDTGFHKIVCSEGAFNIKPCGEKCRLLNVVEGNVSCICYRYQNFAMGSCKKSALRLHETGSIERSLTKCSEKTGEWVEKLRSPCKNCPHFKREEDSNSCSD